MNDELNKYYYEIIEDTQMACDEYRTPEMAFTATTIEKISELIDCKDVVIEHCLLTKANGNNAGEIHAYGQSSNGEVLYLFYTDYSSSNDIKSKSYSDAEKDLTRPQSFYQAALRCAHADKDSSSPEYAALKFIYDNNAKFSSIQLVVLSNYLMKNLELKKISILTKPVFLDVWDFAKLYDNMHALSDHVAIDIDFESEEYDKYRIPFIQMESEKYGYKCIQAMFPAKLLYQLYERYNTNLLYSNVRYFLGLKGDKKKKPNVAMLDTLRHENEKFLAFNNGITALASGIESTLAGDKTDVTDPENTDSHQYITMGTLRKIMDFRIINGGQTTAVIFNAKKLSKETKDKDKKVNLLGVFVQLKLIISDDIESIASKIVQSTNFQNQVKITEFSVSNTFNTTLETIAKSVPVPSQDNEMTYWFYERLRGQYDQARKSFHTSVEQKMFEKKNPSKRKFTKEDVAKVWTCWGQKPHDAVKGAGTAYLSFMKEYESKIPDETFYKKTVALIIIYKFLFSRPENKQYANGKSTVIAYALAMLSYCSNARIDLIKIWENQGLSDNLKIFLNTICDNIYIQLKNRAEYLNTSILSNGKSAPCFEFISKQDLGADYKLLKDDRC